MKYLKYFEKYSEIENSNIFWNKYNSKTIHTPLIPDAILVISENPNAIKFTDKKEFTEFSDKQIYFSASSSHCFYNEEEYKESVMRGNKKSEEAENSELLFETGHEIVQVWDDKNKVGYIIPSDRTKK